MLALPSAEYESMQKANAEGKGSVGIIWGAGELNGKSVQIPNVDTKHQGSWTIDRNNTRPYIRPVGPSNRNNRLKNKVPGL